MHLGDLQAIARGLSGSLRDHRREGITDQNALDVQMMCICEEAGELAGAYRRWTGRARRTGEFRDVEDELADVLIVTAVFADRLGVSIEEVIMRKLDVIYQRGWREDGRQSGDGA